MKRLGLVLSVLLLASIGCRKPYHEAMLVDIGTSEVAILVETVNDNGQAVIAPNGKGENQNQDGELVDFYNTRVVNARKVEIPYYWKQTKRYLMWEDGNTGKWTASARLIVVDTAPETRRWTASKDSGTSAADQAIWAESKDSVGFSTGISVTARIANKNDAILFLSNYPPKSNRVVETKGGDPFNVEVASLDDVMDEEVRTKVQEIFAYESAAHPMDTLRERKQEIMDVVQNGRAEATETERSVEGVVDFFKKRGITITSIGQFGGFTYENPKIQESIDKVFEAQQDEEVARAEAKAAEQRKEALRLQGQGEAEKSVETARGKAEGVKLEAEAEAEAIKLVADAKAYELEKLSENPEAYLALKNLEIEMERLQAWDGKYPSYLIQGGQSSLGVPNLLLTTPDASKPQK